MNKSEKFWDRIAARYDQAEESFELIHQKVVNNTKPYLKASDLILDYGCATGTKTFELAGSVKEIQGIDISSKMIKIAKERAVEDQIENVEFTQAMIFDEQFTPESYDVIMAFNIIHALKDQRQVIKRIEQLLKPGGLFISITACLREKMTFLNRCQLYVYLLLMKTGIFPNMLTRFKFPEVTDLITSGNLQILKTEKIFHKMSGYYIVAKRL